jgi:hypothetical protein
MPDPSQRRPLTVHMLDLPQPDDRVLLEDLHSEVVRLELCRSFDGVGTKAGEEDAAEGSGSARW